MEVTLTIDLDTEDSHEAFSVGRELASVLLSRSGEGEPRSDVGSVRVATGDGVYDKRID